MGRPMSASRVARPLAVLIAVAALLLLLAVPAGASSGSHDHTPRTAVTTATTATSDGHSTPPHPTVGDQRPDDPAHTTAGDDHDDEPHHHHDDDCDGDDHCDHQAPSSTSTSTTTSTTTTAPVEVLEKTETFPSPDVLGESLTSDEPGIYDAPRPVAVRSLPNTGSWSTGLGISGAAVLAAGIVLVVGERMSRPRTARGER